MSRLLVVSLLFTALLAAPPLRAEEPAAPPEHTLSTDELAQKLPPQQLKEYLSERDDVAVKLAKINNGQDHKVAILVPGFFFATLLVGILGVLFYRSRREKQLHETLRLMIEKGAQIPAELLHPPSRPGSDLKRGLLLVGAGLGLAIMLMATQGFTNGQWTVAFIPLLMGGGYLVSWVVEPANPTSRTQDQLAPRG